MSDFFLSLPSNREYHLIIAVSKAKRIVVCKIGQNISPRTIIPYSLGVKYIEYNGNNTNPTNLKEILLNP